MSVAVMPKQFYRGILPTTTSNVVATVPAGKQWIVTNLVVNNKSTVTAFLNVVISGIPFLTKVPIPPGAPFTLDCSQVVAPGITIVAYGETTDSVTLHVAGVEMDL